LSAGLGETRVFENVLLLLIDGLALGCIYALIALGYTMVYGIIKLINFAHGEFFMVGGYAALGVIAMMPAAGMAASWAGAVQIVLCMAVAGLAAKDSRISR
jgi:branched-chain amino acid transport system permease protein